MSECRPLCPSYAAVPGALLLGRLGEEGHVHILRTPIPVDLAFLDLLDQQGTDPDQQFRFAGPCQKGTCHRWSDGRCSLVEEATQLVSHLPPADALPDCGIRDGCRWFTQEGGTACTACALVVRRMAEPTASASFSLNLSPKSRTQPTHTSK